MCSLFFSSDGHLASIYYTHESLQLSELGAPLFIGNIVKMLVIIYVSGLIKINLNSDCIIHILFYIENSVS